MDVFHDYQSCINQTQHCFLVGDCTEKASKSLKLDDISIFILPFNGTPSQRQPNNIYLYVSKAVNSTTLTARELLSDYPTYFSCSCPSRRILHTNCEVTFYDIYNNADVYLYVIGILLSLYFMAVIIPEVIWDWKKMDSWKDSNAFFVGKIVIFLTCLFKLIVHAMWGYDSITKTVDAPFVEFMIGTISQVLELTAYVLIFITWVSLHNKVEGLSLGDSKQFLLLQKFLGISLLVIFITLITLSLITIVPSLSKIFTNVYYMVAVIYGLILVIWSTFQSIKVLSLASSLNIPRTFKKKCVYFLFLNLSIILYLTCLIVYLVNRGFDDNVWIYLIYISAIRGEEFVMMFFIVLILKRNQRLFMFWRNWKLILANAEPSINSSVH